MSSTRNRNLLAILSDQAPSLRILEIGAKTGPHCFRVDCQRAQLFGQRPL